MRRSMLCIFLLLVSVATYAGPFGLEMGTSLSELSKQMALKPTKSNSSIYTTPAVPKMHPDFDDYHLIITPTHGLCKVIAWSRAIETSVYGTELVSKFGSLQESLTAKYGNPKRYDYLKHGSIWNEPREWMTGLLKKERVLTSFWPAKDVSLPDNLKAIVLDAIAFGSGNAMINLSYEFNNSNQCLNWIKSQKDSAL